MKMPFFWREAFKGFTGSLSRTLFYTFLKYFVEITNMFFQERQIHVEHCITVKESRTMNTIEGCLQNLWSDYDSLIWYLDTFLWAMSMIYLEEAQEEKSISSQNVSTTLSVLLLSGSIQIRLCTFFGDVAKVPLRLVALLCFHSRNLGLYKCWRVQEKSDVQ